MHARGGEELPVASTMTPTDGSLPRAASNVTVEVGQKLITTGLYAFVRHPMYVGALIMMIGIPLALGSWWGLVILIPGVIVLVLRILDEEKVLKQELDGYSEYTQKVRYRLVPYVW